MTRTEYDGTVSVLMDRFQGKKLNAPNDLAVHSDGAIWFTDPGYGIMSNYEGHKAAFELPANVYRLDQMIALDGYQRANGENDLPTVGNFKKVSHFGLAGWEKTRWIDSVPNRAYALRSGTQRDHLLAESGTNADQAVGMLQGPFQQRPYMPNRGIKVDVGSTGRRNHGNAKRFPE